MGKHLSSKPAHHRLHLHVEGFAPLLVQRLDLGNPLGLAGALGLE